MRGEGTLGLSALLTHAFPTLPQNRRPSVYLPTREYPSEQSKWSLSFSFVPAAEEKGQRVVWEVTCAKLGGSQP